MEIVDRFPYIPTIALLKAIAAEETYTLLESFDPSSISSITETPPQETKEATEEEKEKKRRKNHDSMGRSRSKKSNSSNSSNSNASFWTLGSNYSGCPNGSDQGGKPVTFLASYLERMHSLGRFSQS